MGLGVTGNVNQAWLPIAPLYLRVPSLGHTLPRASCLQT